MASFKRLDGESMEDYRARLKAARQVEKQTSRGRWLLRRPSLLERIENERRRRELEQRRKNDSRVQPGSGDGDVGAGGASGVLAEGSEHDSGGVCAPADGSDVAAQGARSEGSNR